MVFVEGWLYVYNVLFLDCLTERKILKDWIRIRVNVRNRTRV